MLVRNRVGGKDYFYPVITVNMTDLDVIRGVASLFRTKVNALKHKPSRKPAFRAYLLGARAAYLMRLILPLMSERRSAKIREILSFHDTKVPTEVRRKVSCQEAQRRRRKNENGQFMKD